MGTMSTITSRPILLSNLEYLIDELEWSGEWITEFDSLGHPTTQFKSMDAAHNPFNVIKNRYPHDNLGAYDETRVILSEIPGEKYSDYINANWIDGYKDKQRYIVTQAPLESTINDFYRMIWDNNVHQVIMLANSNDLEKNKCTKYWPDDFATYGEIEVSLQRSIHHSSEMIQRIYSLRLCGIIRVLVHYHFLTWPDQSVPKHPNQLLNLIQTYRSSDVFSRAWPLLVHCSAGVGRTGSFVLTDIMFDMAENEDNIDFLKYTGLLRNQRISMIEKPEQYFFSYKVILLALQNGLFKKLQ